MTITLQQLLVLFVALFTLYSPLSIVGPYAALMKHLSRTDQKKLAFAVFLNVLVVLLLFVWVGQFIFDILGVNSDSLGIAGGIVLMSVGLPMMFGKNSHEYLEEGKELQTWREMTVLPMTFPMTIDGTTAGYVVSATGYANNTIDLLAISVVVALFALVTLTTIYLSPPFTAILSLQARRVLRLISGIVLVAIAVQLFATGLKGLFPVLAGT